MSIDSCDHGDFVAVYEVASKNECPVCNLDEQLKDAEAQIKALKDELENANDSIVKYEAEDDGHTSLGEDQAMRQSGAY